MHHGLPCRSEILWSEHATGVCVCVRIYVYTHTYIHMYTFIKSSTLLANEGG